MRTIAIMTGVFVALWMTALLLVAVGTDAASFVDKAFDKKIDPRAALPAYKDHAYAVLIYRNQNEAGREYVPFVEWQHRPLATKTLNIDENGRRTHTVGRDNNVPGAETVGFFGGSAMFGTGVDDNNTIPARFDAATTEARVTNYAQTGYTSRQGLAVLMNLIAAGEAPKVAVFYDGFNDVRNLCNRIMTDRLAGTAMERRYRALMDKGKVRDGIYGVLVAPIMNLFVSAKTTTGQDYACANDPMLASRVADAMVQSWIMADRIITGKGGRFYGFLQPNRFTGKPKVDYLPPGINPDGAHEGLLQREFDAVYPLIRERLGESGLAWTDLSNAFDVDEPLFVDYSHVVDAGNEIIAQRMRERLYGE